MTDLKAEKYKKMLQEIGGWDNSLVSVNSGAVRGIIEDLERIEADKERLERDAERYRWLRDRDLETINQGGVFAGMTPDNIILNGVDLDEVIDEAIRGVGDG